jgi:drug/metabolite transporter (DMT)-like permease
VLVSISGDKVPAITWAGCLLAIMGVVALGFDGGGSAAAGAASAGMNVGDCIALFGAASYSLYIFRISTFGRQGLPGNLTQVGLSLPDVRLVIWVICELGQYWLPSSGVLTAK